MVTLSGTDADNPPVSLQPSALVEYYTDKFVPWRAPFYNRCASTSIHDDYIAAADVVDRFLVIMMSMGGCY